MQPFRQLLPFDWRLLMVPSIVLAATMVTAYAAKALTVRALRQLQGPTGKHVASVVADTLRGPFWIWTMILGIYLAVEYADLPPKTERWLGRVLEIFVVISLTWIASPLAGNLAPPFGLPLLGTAPHTKLNPNPAE